MPFLSRRFADPQVHFVDPGLPLAAPKPPSQSNRSRAVSDGVFKRVSGFFSTRKRARSKPPPLQTTQCRTSVAFIRSSPVVFSKLSTDSTPPSSPEIRRPSGLGRRASSLESTRKLETDDVIPFNHPPCSLLFHTTQQPEIVTATRNLPLPAEIFSTVLSYLSRSDLTVTALISHKLCTLSRQALYHSLDFQLLTEPSLERLCATLASNKHLAARVNTLVCHFWPSSQSQLPDARALPSTDFLTALRNMWNLRVLTVRSFGTLLVDAASALTFSLTHLTILDESLTQVQHLHLRTWLMNQSRLQYLSFPHLLEFAACSTVSLSFRSDSSSEPSMIASEDEYSDAFLPSLEVLQAPTQMATTLCSAMGHCPRRITLHVHDTLYTGLRPAIVLRALKGVKEMHVIFGHEVDKRTAEKFLGMAGSTLSKCESGTRALDSLHLEAMWSGQDSAETLYKIITSIISRFQGLRRLKLTTPYRSTQAFGPVLLSFPLPPGIPSLPSPVPGLGSPCARLSFRNSVGSTMIKEFVACGSEKLHAKVWTKRCPTLCDVQFDFSASATEDDVELCGLWFRRGVSTHLTGSG